MNLNFVINISKCSKSLVLFVCDGHMGAVAVNDMLL
jgi:hypothetical protein